MTSHLAWNQQSSLSWTRRQIKSKCTRWRPTSNRLSKQSLSLQEGLKYRSYSRSTRMSLLSKRLKRASIWPYRRRNHMKAKNKKKSSNKVKNPDKPLKNKSLRLGKIRMTIKLRAKSSLKMSSQKKIGMSFQRSRKMRMSSRINNKSKLINLKRSKRRKRIKIV